MNVERSGRLPGINPSFARSASARWDRWFVPDDPSVRNLMSRKGAEPQRGFPQGSFSWACVFSAANGLGDPGLHSLLCNRLSDAVRLCALAPLREPSQIASSLAPWPPVKRIGMRKHQAAKKLRMPSPSLLGCCGFNRLGLRRRAMVLLPARRRASAKAVP